MTPRSLLFVLVATACTLPVVPARADAPCAGLARVEADARMGVFATDGARERLDACIQSPAAKSHPGLLGITAAALGRTEDAQALLAAAAARVPLSARLAVEARQLALCTSGRCDVPVRSHADVLAAPVPVATRYLSALTRARPAQAIPLARALLASGRHQDTALPRDVRAARVAALATALDKDDAAVRTLQDVAWTRFPMEPAVAWMMRPLEDAAMRRRTGDNGLVLHLEALQEARQNFEVLRKATTACKGTLATPASPCPALPRALGCRVGLAAGRALRGGRRAADALPVLETVARACPAEREPALFVLGRAAMAIKGRGDVAVRAFTAVAEEFPSGALADDAWVLCGETHAREGRLPEARAAWKRAVALDGDMATEALRLLAMDALGRGLDAEPHLEALVARGARDPDAWAMGTYWRAMSRTDLDSAVQLLNDLCARQPLALECALARDTLVRWNRPPPPALNVSSAVTPPPPSDAVHALAGDALQDVGLFDEAADFHAAALAGSSSPSVVDHALWGLHRAGGHAVAVAFVRRQRGAQLSGTPSAADAWLWHVAHPLPFRPAVEAAAREMNVPPALLYALVREESGFAPAIHSASGAVGLAQLLPATAMTEAVTLRVELRNERDLEDPATNLRLGASYLARMTRQTGHPLLAVAAYNAGPGVVVRQSRESPDGRTDHFLERFPIAETRAYVRRVARAARVYAALHGLEGPTAWDRVRNVTPADGGTTQPR